MCFFININLFGFELNCVAVIVKNILLSDCKDFGMQIQNMKMFKLLCSMSTCITQNKSRLRCSVRSTSNWEPCFPVHEHKQTFPWKHQRNLAWCPLAFSTIRIYLYRHMYINIRNSSLSSLNESVEYWIKVIIANHDAYVYILLNNEFYAVTITPVTKSFAL